MENFNIILTSSGFNDINNYVSNEMKELFLAISKGRKVLIIANAAPEGSGNYIARDNVKENFLKVGALTADVLDVNQNNINEILNYDILYVLGGDLKPLIDLNKETNFKEYITKFLEKGIYIGESAGAMFLADDLEWAYVIKRGTKKKYDIFLDSYEGLNITEHYIFPHYNKISDELKQKIRMYELEHNMKFSVLNDGEFILENYNSMILK